MGELATLSLSTWALAWAISFWYRTEWLRSELGIYYIYDESGEAIDREESGEVSSWVNCPQCCVIFVSPVALLIHRLSPFISKIFAIIGLGVLFVRWYESLRPKARWWE